MRFTLGGLTIEFKEGFMPKSLSKFLKDYEEVGTKDELTDMFNKLNGNITGNIGEAKTTKRKRGSK